VPVFPNNKTVSLKNFQVILRTVANLDLGEAIRLLWLVDPAHLKQTICATGKFQRIPFEELGDNYADLLKPCSSLIIWFNCGPPKKRSWKKARISQFVADCLLLSVAAHGETSAMETLRQTIKSGAP
jgi:hypothetical protein